MNELVEETTSPKAQWKTEIRRRPDGTLQVHLFHWTDEDVPDYGRVASFWSEVHTAVSIADDLNRARAIAADLLGPHVEEEQSSGSGSG